MAIYFLSLTAIELGYSNNETVTTENGNSILSSDITVTSTQQKVIDEVFSIGLRQALAPRKSFIVPSLSLGYAKQFTKGEIEFTVVNSSTGTTTYERFSDPRQRFDLAFGTFSLKFRLTKFMTLDGSVRTLFKAFEFNNAKNNLKFSTGLSWIF